MTGLAFVVTGCLTFLEGVHGLLLGLQRCESAPDMVLGYSRVYPPMGFKLEVGHYMHVRRLKEVHPLHVRVNVGWKHLDQQGGQV